LVIWDGQWIWLKFNMHMHVIKTYWMVQESHS